VAVLDVDVPTSFDREMTSFFPITADANFLQFPFGDERDIRFKNINTVPRTGDYLHWNIEYCLT